MSKRKIAIEGFASSVLDNGSAGSYSQLVVMKEHMSQIAHDHGVDESKVYPADYFDLMGGVGLGGLITVMLGYLRMTADEAIEAFVLIARAVFLHALITECTPKSNTKRLRKAVESMLYDRGLPLNVKMHDNAVVLSPGSSECKVVVYATTTANLNHPTIFRTYSSRGSGHNPTVVEAICATMTSPPFFSPVRFGPPLREQTFAGGPLGMHNPTRELLREAESSLGKRRKIAQIISIGAGRPRVLSLDQSTGRMGTRRPAEDLASDCEMVAQDLARRWLKFNYLRLNVDRGMETVTNEDWDKLGDLDAHTKAYMETPAITEALEASLRHLYAMDGIRTLEELSK